LATLLVNLLIGSYSIYTEPDLQIQFMKCCQRCVYKHRLTKLDQHTKLTMNSLLVSTHEISFISLKFLTLCEFQCAV